MGNIEITGQEMFETCSATYRSIDIRVVAAKPQNEWLAACLAVRLTRSTPTDVGFHQKSLMRRFGRVETDSLFVSGAVRPSTAWKDVCAELRAGVLYLDADRYVKLEGVDIEQRKTRLRGPRNEPTIADDTKWPCLDLYSSDPKQANLLNDSRALRSSSKFGYDSAFELASAFCESTVGSQNEWNLLVRLPFYATIHGLNVTLDGEHCRFVREQHRRLKDSTIHVGCFVQDKKQLLQRTQPSKNEKVTVSKDRDLRVERFDCSIPSLSMDDWIDVSLSHSRLGDVCRTKMQIRALVPAARRNLLLAAFKEFCPLATLEGYLTSPGAHTLGRSNQADAFERNVAWLFSLLGLTSMVLGSHEHLKDGKTEACSVDIIAIKPGGKMLFLCGCTIGPPKDPDRAKLLHARRLLGERLNLDGTYRIVPLIVTGLSHYSQDQESYLPNYVPVVTSEKLCAIAKQLDERGADDLIQSLFSSDQP